MTGDPSLPIDAPPKFQLADLVKCAEREIRYRQHVYPGLVARGSMSQAKMDFEIAAMEAIAERLRGMQAYAERRGS